MATYAIEVCEPPTRLRLHSVHDDPAEVWTLDLGLSEADGVTTLAFAQLVDDPAVVTDVGPGWQYYLDRFEVARSGGDANTVRWGDDYLKYAAHYAKEFDVEA